MHLIEFDLKTYTPFYPLLFIMERHGSFCLCQEVILKAANRKNPYLVEGGKEMSIMNITVDGGKEK